MSRSRWRTRVVFLVALGVVLGSGLLVGGARSASRAPGLIAFARSDGIYVMQPDGSGIRPLRRGDAAAGATGLAWSPDGSKIAFVGGNPNGVWVMDADGTDLARIATVKTTGGRLPISPSWSPDGRRLAFTANSGKNRDIWVVNADGSNLRRLVQTPQLWEMEVDWSHDGSRIAFAAGRLSSVYVMDANGRNRRILTPALTFEAMSPEWSPNGRSIVFVHWPGASPNPKLGIWVMDSRGGSRHPLLAESSSSGDLHPSWSPDGRRIVFVRAGSKWPDCFTCPVAARDSSEIFLMNADGTGVTRLTNNGVGEGYPDWQADASP